MKILGRTTAAILCLAACAIEAIAIDGKWRGELKLGLNKLPIVLNFNERDGSTICTMDSPNQNAYGIPATVDFASTDSIAVSVNSIGAAFKGQIAQEEIKGIFSQRGYQFPLTLHRDVPLTERRPQTPQPPFPYQQIDTVFCSGDGTSLSGTFCLPEAYQKGKTLMCVFVTGSGPQNRDEEIFEHKPFAVIADYLARNGVASFRYDDRGVAKSKGDYANATVDTFAQDAKAALLFARKYSESPTGIIGHSEGGTIAMLLAQEGTPDFIISLAGMAISGKETVLAQNLRALEHSGLEKKAIDDSMTLLNAVFDEIIRQTSTGEKTLIDPDAIAIQLGVEVPQSITKSLKNTLANSNGYFGSLLAVDARNEMQKISCPVLALNGTLDTQVDAKKNLDAIRSGVKKASALELPGLNHLFQHASTGDVSEYAEIRETISPATLAIILEFLQNLPPVK